MDWTSAVVVRETDRVWETWPIGQRERGEDVYWKTFLSSDLTESTDMTMGVLKIPVGKTLKSHRHAKPEIYFIFRGKGVVTVDEESHDVEAGSAVFIPGGAMHSCRNTEAVDLRFGYVFPADSFKQIEYVFD